MSQGSHAARPGYSISQIVLHWMIVALIVVQLLSHDAMEDYWDRVEDGAAGGLPSDVVSLLHAAAGAAVLALVILRLILRGAYGAPPLPAMNPLLKAAAHANHYAFYGLLILLPLSGAGAIFAGAEAAAEAHGVLVTLLWILLGLHVAAVIYHTLVRRDGLIWRMLVPR